MIRIKVKRNQGKRFSVFLRLQGSLWARENLFRFLSPAIKKEVRACHV